MTPDTVQAVADSAVTLRNLVDQDLRPVATVAAWVFLGWFAVTIVLPALAFLVAWVWLWRRR